MFNIADLPAVRAQLERDAAAAKAAPALLGQTPEVEYARAPDASAAPGTGRPPATQRGSR